MGAPYPIDEAVGGNSKRRSGPIGQRMGADVNDARADPAAATALAAFETGRRPRGAAAAAGHQRSATAAARP